MVFNENHSLRPIWFCETATTEANPKFTTHKNTAGKLSAVWFSNQLEKELFELFTHLKYPILSTEFPIENSKKICLDVGQIYIVNLPLNTIERPIVGATVEVDSLFIVKQILKKENIKFSEVSNNSGSGIIISPEITQNLFLEFSEKIENVH